jgi:uncharacterized protein (TIGR02996 family)
MNTEYALWLSSWQKPDEATTRMAFADWLDENDRPEAALVRALCTAPPTESVQAIIDWFHEQRSWPLEQPADWLAFAVERQQWPDPIRFAGCVTAMGRRWVRIVRRRFREGTGQRRAIETAFEYIASEGGPTSTDVGWNAVCAGVWLAQRYSDIFGLSMVQARELELAEMVHIAGWAWVGLPPLTREVPLEPIIQARERRRGPLPQAPYPSAARMSWWRRLFGA